MKRRATFAAIALLLAAQVTFMRYAGEPYPAIMMPMFRGAAGYSDGTTTLECYDVVLVGEAGETLVRPWELLAEFPDSLHAAMSEVFRPNRTPYTSRGGKLARMRDTAFPGFVAGRSMSEEANESLRAWLNSRARSLCPGQQIARVEFRWRVDRVRLGTVESRPAETFVVLLEGKP